MSDEPIIPPAETDRFVCDVIDLASVRVEWGRNQNPKAKCAHKSLVYNEGESRVWCQDCERTVENFDAFMVIARSFQAMIAEVRRKNAKADEAMTATVNRRAAKEMERTWNAKMGVVCPHCRDVLLPEDIEKGTSSFSREMELARRARAAKSEGSGHE
ncbi:hypothetical protein [Methylobacterium sp. CM6247]